MKSPEQVFDKWASDDRAKKMGDRHWPVVAQGLEHLPKSRSRYLEIGVGSGYCIGHVATHQHLGGECLGIDVSSQMVERAKTATRRLSNVRIERADFLAPGFAPSQPFMAIFSMEVFYYFARVQGGLDKAASLLAPGGRLIVMVDYYAENTPTHRWPEELDTPMTLWSAAEYRDGFRRAGLRGVEQHHLAANAADKSPPDHLGTLCTIGSRSLQLV